VSRSGRWLAVRLAKACGTVSSSTAAATSTGQHLFVRPTEIPRIVSILATPAAERESAGRVERITRSRSAGIWMSPTSPCSLVSYTARTPAWARASPIHPRACRCRSSRTATACRRGRASRRHQCSAVCITTTDSTARPDEADGDRRGSRRLVPSQAELCLNQA
jgi:hypothetical protein